MGRHHHDRQQIEAHQRRATHQQRQAFQGAGVLARQFRQQFDQTQQSEQRPEADNEKGGTPAKILPDDAAQREPEHHCQRRAGRQQAQRLGALPGRGQADGQRGGNRPENGVGKGNPDPAYHQHRKVPGQERQHMAGDKQHEQADQQRAALNLAGEQHKGERHQRHHPGVDGEHDPHLRRLHAEAAGDVREQPDRDELRGVKDKRGDGQGHHP